MSRPPTLRCAVYTRKSSEEGLEQDYNSLHAQRDACESYIRSQVGEGWACLPSAYDDGGISGGTMERSGLKQLLADIAAKRIDVVVVYKVDRLTRSLGDFARIVEIFDTHGVSFVSVTQAFNTTTSMGRLTLNVLLSFAQFEREVTGERIRDKIAASKKKGMWMGGNLPLGYDADGRTLRINEAEAVTVRHIFKRYLEIGSAHVLADELKIRGIRSKLRTSADGRTRGGVSIDRGALYHLLSNPTYLGKIRHKAEAYEGLHKPIIDPQTFDAVQAVLAENRRRKGVGSKRRATSSLMGLLFDSEGCPMTPTFTIRPGGKSYRYYVSAPLQRGVRTSAAIGRIAAAPLERFVASSTERLFAGAALAIKSITLKADAIEIGIHGGLEHYCAENLCSQLRGRTDGLERVWVSSDHVIASFPLPPPERGGRCSLLDSAAEGKAQSANRAPARALRQASCDVSLGNALERLGPYARRIAPLRFLAPDLQAAILAGDYSQRLTIDQLVMVAEAPSWQNQRSLFRSL